MCVFTELGTPPPSKKHALIALVAPIHSQQTLKHSHVSKLTTQVQIGRVLLFFWEVKLGQLGLSVTRGH